MEQVVPSALFVSVYEFTLHEISMIYVEN